ncbi:MAG: hypothetical protein LR011_12095 [Verrucomicrobia bacterium]|nr:hypothetical protein [Verrucomicrobiota bacterium]
MRDHFIRVAGIIAGCSVCIALPFIPGNYDQVSGPISITAQLFAAMSLVFVPIGVVGLVSDAFQGTKANGGDGESAGGFLFALILLLTSTVLILAVALVVLFGVSLSLGCVLLSRWICTAYRGRSLMRHWKTMIQTNRRAIQLYGIGIPLTLLLLQVVFASALGDFSRSRAIANSRGMIGQIEEYRDRHGTYPESLAAVWKDYYPDVMGIEKFHYASIGDSFNLFFEQPGLLLDNFGTREWVVYNPTDEHRMFSHTSWFLILSPQELERSQGWYAVHETRFPHWRLFWFD